MSHTQTVVTVPFLRPLKGAEVIAATKFLVEGKKGTYAPHFYQDHLFDDGDLYLIGQRSGYPYDHLVVSPDPELSGFRPEETYQSAVVMPTSWPGSVYMVGYESDAPIKVAQQFAAELTTILNGEPSDPIRSAWPQLITVCAICEKAVWSEDRFSDVYNCATHGSNTPTKKVAVVPATS